MIKLLICLLGGVAIAVLTLHLRQQRMELNYQTNKLHAQIESHQARLWNQQIQIATYTAPNAIAQTVGHLDVKLVPQKPPTTGMGAWIEQQEASLPPE